LPVRYYIAVINDKLHLKEWNALKLNLKITGSFYVVYFDDTIKQIELNEVTKEVFKEMAYSLN